MALFGPQFIFTIIMFILLTKLGKFYSYGRYLLCHKLYRYLSPNSVELKKSVRTHYKSQTKCKKMSRLFEIDDDKEEFNIPEGATIELSMSPVVAHDLHFIKYSDDFQSFVDVSQIAIIIYTSTEVYMAIFRPSDEINLSVVWCAMAILYGMTTLASIARNYLRTSEGALLFMFAGVSFILSLLVQLADRKFFDFQLKDAFRNVSSNTLALISTSFQTQPPSPNAKVSKHTETTTNQKIYSQLKYYSTNDLLFTCCIAFLSAFIGALFFFPAFRLARLHSLSLKYSQGSKSKRFLFYLSFILPLLVSICWLKFETDAKVTNKTATTGANSTINKFINLINLEKTNSHFFSSTKVFFLNVLFATNLKIYLVVFFFLLRLALYRHYAQSYLNLAFEIAASIRKQSTKVTNTKYMSSISSIYQYYGVVANQYIVPLYVLLFMVFLLKTLGNYTWCGDIQCCNTVVDLLSSWSSNLRQNASNSPNLFKRLESTHFNISQSHHALNKIFTPYVLRSLIGYFTFWTSTIWFTISCIGLLYYHYIDSNYVV
ncbi:transmembrane protein -like [Brachionus plicatilis]|uniref:Transmembrane protein-like n=1 Tax=Brachionus plicatilis TaxID=10195 RepID=A0A3M7PAE7_BRAPC|nr:transmembrane protein -like [Brachionus plicatilis]RMZ96065.1 transmembrane protein -like [Brachionus plicatilis]